MDSYAAKFLDILATRLSLQLAATMKHAPAALGLPAADIPFTTPLFHASIRLIAEGLDGFLIVTADKKFLHETHPERRYGEILDDSDYLDWVGEITNRALAGSKAELLKLGFKLGLEQPRVGPGSAASKQATQTHLSQTIGSDEFYALVELQLDRFELKPKIAL